MNKKFLISWVVIFVVWMAGSFVVKKNPIFAPRCRTTIV